MKEIYKVVDPKTFQPRLVEIDLDTDERREIDITSEEAQRFLAEGLSFRTLRNANLQRFSDYPCDEWIIAQWITALVGEVGEFANNIKKVDRGDFSFEHVFKKLEQEIGDIQIYLDILAYKCGINLAEATILKFNEVSDRVGSPIKIQDNKVVNEENR